MRVLAVAQIADLLERQLEPIARAARRGSGAGRSKRVAVADRSSPSVARDRGVVRRRCARSPCASARSGTRGVGVRVERREQPRIVGRIDDDEHVAEVLRRRAHQRRSADVDLLDQRVERRRRVRGRLDERIQIDDDDIDEADAVALERREIVGAIAPGQDAAVQRRDAAS